MLQIHLNFFHRHDNLNIYTFTVIQFNVRPHLGQAILNKSSKSSLYFYPNLKYMDNDGIFLIRRVIVVTEAEATNDSV